MLVHLVAERVAIVPCRRDRHGERLPARAYACCEHIPELSVGLSVELVKYDAATVKPVLGVSICADCSISATVLGDYLFAQHSASRGKHWASLHHAAGNVEHDGCLLTVSGCRHDLRALLAICHQQVERYTCAERALAVFPWDLNVAGAVLAQAIGTESAEQWLDDVSILPLCQHERTTCVRSFDVR